jgi:hypothetical protein
VRVARHGSKVFLDLANDESQVIEIDADGRRVASTVPVRFRRPGGMLSLPIPTAGGSIDELREFVNVKSEDDFVLLVAFALGALRPDGPFAHLELLGEQGTAKSTTARVLRSLIDPNFSPLRAEPASERDLAISASNAWMPVWDNISNLPAWMSDALCRLSTGGGFSTRMLYTDGDEKLFQLMRPAVLTGIGDVVVRGDLLDRTIVLRLPCLTERRIAEASFWRRFEDARPRILGALLDAVSMALSRIDTLKVSKLPRLVDFALWTAAGETAFGWEPGTVLAAYFANQEEGNCIVLEGSAIASLILELAAESSVWTGTATELLTTLHSRAHAIGQSSRMLPQTPVSLRKALNRLIPNLRKAGVDVDFARVGKQSTRTIFIRSRETRVGSVGAVGDDRAESAA